MKKSLFQLHGAVLLWGFTGVLGKAISLDAPVLVWYRLLLTSAFMACILMYRNLWVKVERRDMLQLVLVGCLMSLHWVAFYGAIKVANASIALVCLSTASVFTSLLDPIVNRGRHDLREVLLGLLALLGVYFIYRFQKFYINGIIFGVAAAVICSVFTVLNKRIAHKYPARVMVFYEMGTGFIFLSLLLPLQFHYFPHTRFQPRGGHLFTHHWMHNDWLWLVVLSLCCTVWAQSLALTALKKLSAFTVSLSVNLEPVYGIILAFVFYKENRQLDNGFYLGLALIMLSVILQMIRLLRPVGMSPGFIKERGGVE